MFLKQSLEWSPVEEDPLLAVFSFLLEIPGNLQCSLGLGSLQLWGLRADPLIQDVRSAHHGGPTMCQTLFLGPPLQGTQHHVRSSLPLPPAPAIVNK